MAYGNNGIETGWLIELRLEGEGYPKWWTGHIPNGMVSEWTNNSLKAIRFSRKIDAENVMIGVFGISSDGGDFDMPSEIIATSHEWG